MTNNQVDLIKVFQAISQALQANQTELNQVDTHNHNHGDNMVDVFTQITQAMQENRGAAPSIQLESAAQKIQSLPSGSAQYYTQSLNQAAQELAGNKTITPENAITLLQTLLGGGQASVPSGGSSGDLLGTLLSGLTGQAKGASGSSNSQPGKLDWLTLAGAGLEFLQSKQAGKDNLTALMDALMPGQQTQQAPHRKQSGAIVANTLIQVLGSMLNKSGTN